MSSRKGVTGSNLMVVEHAELLSGISGNAVLQQTITTWLTTQLNTLSTNDACAEFSAQAFQINSYQTAAHKV